MGSHADAVLAYGYNLGGGEKWEVAEADGEYGELTLDWFTDEGDRGFEDAAMGRLLASVGFTETWTKEDHAGFRERKEDALRRLGVQVKTCVCYEFPAYLLTTQVFEADSGDVEVIDLNDLIDVAESGDSDARLRSALDVLGLTPTQLKPSWVLIATYG